MESPDNVLFNKIYGCLAAGYVYVSMGELTRRLGSYGKKGYDPFEGYLGPLEGAHYKAIEKEYGRIENLMARTTQEKTFRWANGPKMHIPHFEYEVGMTEDGAERRFLVIKALMDKNGRITAEDVQAAWLKYIRPENFGYLLTPRDSVTYENMKKYPAREVGRYDRWPGNVDVLMMIPPIGIVNACNPKQAALDALDAASAIQSPFLSYAPYSAAALAAGIAEGLKPDATVDSMIDAGIKYCGESNVADVIEEILEIAKKNLDIYKVREPLWQRFGGRVPTDSLEVVSESFAMFYIAKGDPHIAGVGGTNLGRDADCVASLAAALGGAFKGVESVRRDWVEKVDKAVENDPHTVIDISIEEQARGLYQVLQSNIDELKAQVSLVESVARIK